MSNPFRSIKAGGGRQLTRKEQHDLTLRESNNVMMAILADPLGPTKVLADGKLTWINRFLYAMRGFPGVDRDTAEYQWLLYEQEHARRFPGETPKQVMDDTHVRSETTAQEVRDAFEHDTSSSREQRQELYGPDDYDVDNAVQRAKDSFTDDELLKKEPTLEDIAKGLPTLLADTEVVH